MTSPSNVSPRDAKQKNISQENADYLFDWLLGVATSFGTISSSGFSCDYNTFYTAKDEPREPVVVHAREDGETLEVVAPALWRSRSELFCSDGEVVRSLNISNVKITILLSTHEFAEADTHKSQCRLRYAGIADRERGIINWTVVKGLYESFAGNSLRTTEYDKCLVEVFDRFPYVLWSAA